MFDLRPYDVPHLVDAVGDFEIAFRRGRPTRGPAARSDSSSPWPPVIEMPGPLATTRGPMRKPSLMASRRVDEQNGASRRRAPR